MSGEPEQEDQEAMEIYSRIRGLKPKRAGTYLGNEGEKYYVALSEEKVYELSPLAYYVWLLCDGEHTVDQLIDIVVGEIGAERSEALPPVVLTVDALASENLVTYQ